MSFFKKKFFKSFFDAESDGGEARTKFTRNRIKMVEKHIPELGKALSDYTDKMAASRDCIDRVAEVMEKYAKAENVTTAFKLRLNDFANVLADVGTKQDAQVHAMDAKVLEQLTEHEKLCGHVQAQLKLSVMANAREKTWLRQLRRLRESEVHNPEEVSLAEAECLKAKGESARCYKNLEEQIEVFERKRVNAVKEALLSWCLAELHYHAKALELFTEAYRIAADIDVNADVEEFRSVLTSVMDGSRSEFPRSESVARLLQLPPHSSGKSTDSGILLSSSARCSGRSSLS